MQIVKYLSVFFPSIFFFSLTFSSAPDEFRVIDSVLIIFLLAFTVGLEVFIARLFIKYQVMHNLILAGFTAINILCANLIMNTGFLGLPKYGKVLTLLLAVFILNAFMNMLAEFPRIARMLLALFAVATGGIFAHALVSPEPILEMSTEHGKVSAKNIRVVDFKTKPNVYFVSFDSLIPKIILNSNLGLETTPYHDLLDAEFRSFRNFFADRIPTKQSLNSLLALDLNYFSDAEEQGIGYYFFTGLIRSPLFEIFKRNGYETNSFFKINYLGDKKGPHVDNYFFNNTPDVRWGGACSFIDIYRFRKMALFGYCAAVKSEWLNSVLGGSSFKEMDFFIEILRSGIKKKTPQVFLAYIYSPGHTPLGFNINDKGAIDRFRKVYFDASKETALHLTKLITFIKKEDPSAILYVFGDHGPILSRGGTFLENETFYIQDRFAVYGGIYPPDRCEESFSNPFNKNFMTVSQGAHMIIRCLSGGENAFITQEDYRFPKITPKDEKYYYYEDYLYE